LLELPLTMVNFGWWYAEREEAEAGEALREIRRDITL